MTQYLDREPTTDQSNYTKVYLGEPMSILGFLIGAGMTLRNYITKSFLVTTRIGNNS